MKAICVCDPITRTFIRYNLGTPSYTIRRLKNKAKKKNPQDLPRIMPVQPSFDQQSANEPQASITEATTCNIFGSSLQTAQNPNPLPKDQTIEAEPKETNDDNVFNYNEEELSFTGSDTEAIF